MKGLSLGLVWLGVAVNVRDVVVLSLFSMLYDMLVEREVTYAPTWGAGECRTEAKAQELKLIIESDFVEVLYGCKASG